MHVRVLMAAAIIIAALSLSACGSSRTSNNPGVSPAASPGYFTDAQASDGAAVYAASCATCHGAQLQGHSAPSLSGARFAATLRSYETGQIMFDYIRQQMPFNTPGSLTPAQYYAVSAYLLQENGYASGRQTLDATSIGRVNFSTAFAHASAAAAATPNTNEIVHR